VKCIRRQLEKNGQLLERNKDGISYREHFMLREAFMGIVLDHPNIAKMHSYAFGKKHFYFFCEMVHGQVLKLNCENITRY
jgi:hypothetical protein